MFRPHSAMSASVGGRGKKKAAGAAAPRAPATAADTLVQLPYVALALIHLRMALCALAAMTVTIL